MEGNGLHKDLLQDLNTLGVNDFQVKMAQNYESAIEYLDKTLGVRSKLDEEKRAEWAGVTSATLKKAIPFKHVFDNAIGYLEHELMEHAEWFKSHLEPLTLSVKDDIQVQTTEFEANYVGEGVWRVDGEALIQTKVKYVTSYSNHGPAEETQEMFLTIGFTIYFDYPKMEITDVILRGVKQ